MIFSLNDPVRRLVATMFLVAGATGAEPLAAQEYEAVPQLGVRVSTLTVHEDRFVGVLASVPLDWNMEIVPAFDLALSGRESSWTGSLDFMSRFGPTQVFYIGAGGIAFGLKDPLRTDGRMEESLGWSAFAGLEFRRRYDQALRPNVEVRAVRLGQESLFRLSAGLSLALERPR